MQMFSFVVCLAFLSLIECQPVSRTNTKYCKMSHTGVEYDGSVSHTESGIPCQYWNSPNPTHEMDSSITDDDFKGGSKSAARNYCRNVKTKYANPWCYTTNPDVVYETCNIPLCNFDCRVTLLGAEYGGQLNESITGRVCLKWSEKLYRKYLKKQNISTSERVLLDDRFPELSRKKASNYCRNPTDDPNGPWCFVEDHFTPKAKYEKEYCDIRLCNETDCTAGTGRLYDKNVYSHFVDLKNSSTLEFSLQLWNIDLEKAVFRVALVVYPLPLSGTKLIDMYNGIEVYISNHRLGFVYGTGQDTKWYDITGLLSGVDKRSFIISWFPEKTFISLKVSDYPKEFQDRYNDAGNPFGTLIGYKKGELSYYSISGDAAFWDLPCTDGCQEHITIQPYCNVYKKMKKAESSYEVPFIVRSDHTVYIELRVTPNSHYPYFRIEILGSWNKTSIALIENEHSTPDYLHSTTYSSILSYWTWSKFLLSVTGNRLKLEWLKELILTEMVIEIEHAKVANAKWYSICSKGTAHWGFNCSPLDTPQLPERQPPECARSKRGRSYVGKQWISKTGQPCFPWVHKDVVKVTKHYKFRHSSREEQENYCRNLDGDRNGPYCYVADVEKLPDIVLKKEACHIRPCIGSQCKVTGFGREYDGNLDISRSKRTCKQWLQTNTTIVPNIYTANLTQNYCRNPNDNAFGPWCYTADPLMEKDLCSIEDCNVNDACTFAIQDERKVRRFYLHPDWIRSEFSFKVKTWDPSKESGIAILIMFENLDSYFTLKIGTDDNEQVELTYCCVNGETIRLKDRVIPNLIPSGYWQGFWIRVPPRDIELGYEGSDHTIFEWERPWDFHLPPLTVANFISVLSLGSQWVGFNFPCFHCFIEETRMADESAETYKNAFYPINYWSENNTFSDTLVLHMRSKVENDNASTIVKLFEESLEKYLYVVFKKTSVTLFNEMATVLELKKIDHPVLTENYWTTVTIRFDQNHIQVNDHRQTLINWRSKGIRILRFYYFVVISYQSTTTWVANCDRPVIDDDPINGGWSKWSEWICNVHCGGGLGYRERFCNNPHPNYKGLPCIGASQINGQCNKFECGCLNPASVEKAYDMIRRHAINKEVNVGKDITLQCETSILEDMKIDSPTSYVQWLKNGYRIKGRNWKLDKLDFKKTDLHLRYMQEEDSGLYMCIVNPDCLPANNSTFIPITIIAVVVNSEEEHLVRETTDFQLNCKGLPLSFIYTDLSQSWELNNDLLIDYTTTDLAEANIDTLYSVNPYYSGVWQCKIFQYKLNLTWITNRFKMKVLGPPTIYTYLSEEDAPSIIFYGWNQTMIFLFLWSAILFEMIAVGYIVYWYWKTRQELLGNA